MKIKMEGTKYSRDLNTMALVLTDRSEITKYEIEQERYRADKARETEINRLKAELEELKILVRAMSNKG
jgi:hypothetical protein